jgi:plastocyanin
MQTLLAAAVTIGAVLSPEPGAGETRTIMIRGKSFAPNTVSIEAGDKLVFTSDDGVPHRLFSASPGIAFPFKEIAPGGAATVEFAQAGNGEVRCANHASMKLVVTVR